jgi:hypothetical protein
MRFTTNPALPLTDSISLPGSNAHALLEDDLDGPYVGDVRRRIAV